ncbi:MAG TPA: NAD(+)/NADH kinase [Dehalococcoidia bacterium]|nr:NAD(+)/NADH kinase [Dehalococcoidia bacterium]
MKKVGIFVHPSWQEAHALGRRLEAELRKRVPEVWLTAAWDEATYRDHLPGSELLVCVGGDGTMLWAARTVCPEKVPILGVNMGRLGFLAELNPAEAHEKLPLVLDGAGRIEERTMLQVEVNRGQVYHALNDVIIGRSTVGKPVYIDASVDGERLAYYRADAVIVATATGSTAYSFSAGGPILYPESQELVLTPVAPHLVTGRSLVLDPDARIELTVATDHTAVFSADGQEDHHLSSGSRIAVKRSPYVTRFLRLSPPSHHYAQLAERLGWLRAIDDSAMRGRAPDGPSSAAK